MRPTPIAELLELLREVSEEAMGGTPHLFGPACGWETWFSRVKSALKAAAPAGPPCACGNHKRGTTIYDGRMPVESHWGDFCDVRGGRIEAKR